MHDVFASNKQYRYAFDKSFVKVSPQFFLVAFFVFFFSKRLLRRSNVNFETMCVQKKMNSIDTIEEKKTNLMLTQIGIESIRMREKLSNVTILTFCWMERAAVDG